MVSARTGTAGGKLETREKKEVPRHLNCPLPTPQVNPQLKLDIHTLTLLFAAGTAAVAKAGQKHGIRQS